MPEAVSLADGALRRDRGALATGLALCLLAAAAWVVVVRQAVGGDMPMPGDSVTPSGAGVFILSWGVMMAAMMLPSAVPMIALYGAAGRRLSQNGRHVVPTALFAATYLAVWLALGGAVYAAGAAVALAAPPGSTPAMALPYALAVVLLGAGAYQFTALKRACLRQCQSPLSFLMARWRTGYLASLRLGFRHAAYCVGCCWGLMVVLVAAGAMSLPWVLGIAAVVFVEKLLPHGRLTAGVGGAALIVLGIAVAVHPSLAVALRGGMALAPMPGAPDMPM